MLILLVHNVGGNTQSFHCFYTIPLMHNSKPKYAAMCRKVRGGFKSAAGKAPNSFFLFFEILKVLLQLAS